MRRIPRLEPYDEEQARYVARIVGDDCANARAVKCLNERRAAGEHVGLFLDGRTIVVSPVVAGDQEVA